MCGSEEESCLFQEMFTEAGKLKDRCIQSDAVAAFKKHRDHPKKKHTYVQKGESTIFFRNSFALPFDLKWRFLQHSCS